MRQIGSNNIATQFLIQMVAINAQCGNAAYNSIDTGLGRVHLSAHSLSKKTFFLFFYLLHCKLVLMKKKVESRKKKLQPKTFPVTNHTNIIHEELRC